MPIVMLIMVLVIVTIIPTPVVILVVSQISILIQNISLVVIAYSCYCHHSLLLSHSWPYSCYEYGYLFYSHSQSYSCWYYHYVFCSHFILIMLFDIVTVTVVVSIFVVNSSRDLGAQMHKTNMAHEPCVSYKPLVPREEEPRQPHEAYSGLLEAIKGRAVGAHWEDLAPLVWALMAYMSGYVPREREIDRHTHIYIYIYSTYTYIHIKHYVRYHNMDI